MDWVDVTNEELDAYISLCILRNVYKGKDEDLRELWNPVSGRPIFRDTMSINRFEEIRRMLRFDNRATRIASLRNDKLAANRLLLDGLVANSQKSYVHSECVTVNKELYPFRGRCPHIQYMPSKPAKYGLKFWVLADAQTYYVSYIATHTGKDKSVYRGTRSLGQQVVISATEHIPAGRNVTTDNFFTSLPLIR